MAAPVLVTGGTGVLGRRVVDQLLARGSHVRVMSRNAQAPRDGVEQVVADLSTGDGAEASLRDVETIVHCAGSAKGDDDKARNLIRAVPSGTAPHVVFISIVGVDRIPVSSMADRAMFGFYATKFAAERVVADSGLPWTTVRTTQFHDLLLTMVQEMAKVPVVPLPSGFRFQPIDVDEVAGRLVELALSGPAGRVPDLGGPQILSIKELVSSYLRVTHRRRPMLPIRLPGKAAKAYREGANLAPEHAVGALTWEGFLATRVRRVGG